MMTWVFLVKGMQPEDLGLIPGFLDENDPLPAAKQFDREYMGGWTPMPGFTLNKDFSLSYPGDPPMHALAFTKMRDELIVFYEHEWVAVIQPDNSFEASRMD